MIHYVCNWCNFSKNNISRIIYSSLFATNFSFILLVATWFLSTTAQLIVHALFHTCTFMYKMITFFSSAKFFKIVLFPRYDLWIKSFS